MSPVAVFRMLLWCYPAPFRHEYGSEMTSAFHEELRAARRDGGRMAEAAVWMRTLADLFLTAPVEHFHMIMQDLRYSFRTLAAQPGFAAVAIFSLALGIGANLAVFSVLHSVLLSRLPVEDPNSLVMLTEPNASGVGQGLKTGERSLLSYGEFEQLRDHCKSFANLMAVQSHMERVAAHVNGGDAEDIRYRLVSSEYFTTLGVAPQFGRALGGDDAAAPLIAVISDAFWRRRFEGKANVIGSRIRIHDGVFTIAGVMPRSFFGETVGERPDIWLPLLTQPIVLPGRDWLHDRAAVVEKTMWLHAFGRLRPGVTPEQAQAEANVVFHQGLATHYGAALTPERAKTFLNQQLRLRSASKGASQLRGQIAEPLTLLQWSAAIVLLITCANLANLMLARTVGRFREISVRLALGAGRAQLVRLAMTESLMIATLGGVAGVFLAIALRRGLLGLAAQSMDLPLQADAALLVFAFGATLFSGLLLGLLPAARINRMHAGAGLREQGRGLTRSAGWLRTSRAVVAGQLALSLPLVLGAGLLTRTLLNLERVDVGFAKDQLLMVDVDARTAGYGEDRQLRLYRDLLARVRSVHGVQAASWTENGLFTGSDSGDTVEVEGYIRQGDGDQGSRYDHVGPAFFSTVGARLLQGREIDERDLPGTAKVCVINQAFAKRFFAGRNPIGMHVTQVFGNQRNTFEIVGVVNDLRSRSLRGLIEHRYYLPSAQPVFAQDSVVFAVRTSGDTSAVAQAVRREMLSLDPRLPVADIRPLAGLINSRMVQDRTLARLSTAFGVIALLLAAIGLYGVLSYGVARRTGEIGIRKALGATHADMMRMILGETGTLLAVGLVAGAVLAMAGSRLVASRLYGTAPNDALSVVVTLLVLTTVAVVAACLPAHRAARVDPVVALRHE